MRFIMKFQLKKKVVVNVFSDFVTAFRVIQVKVVIQIYAKELTGNKKLADVYVDIAIGNFSKSINEPIMCRRQLNDVSQILFQITFKPSPLMC